jgi:virginiamycin A acetyltransferase
MLDCVAWESATEVAIRLNPAIIDQFDRHRVFCDHQYDGNTRRWKSGELILLSKDLAIEPYIGYLGGYHLFPMGAYSYSHSPWGIDFTVGRYCSIATNVRRSGWQHPVASVTTSLATCNPLAALVRTAFHDQGIDRLRLVPAPQKPSPKVGNDVWIGADVTLMGGVAIGDGAIVAAGSIVTRNVEPYAIVGGNPAGLIRWRHPREIIDGLLELAWWRFNLADLQDLDFGNAGHFLERLAVRAPSLEPWTPRLFHIWKTVQEMNT